MDTVSKAKRSEIMSKIRSKHTKPEIILRKALRARGIEYKLHYSSKKIDIALPSRKIAIFVDGCFWHGCRKHCRLPYSNVDYWIPKIGKNRERDRKTSKELRKIGWNVVRVWEHELKDLDKIVTKIEKRLK